MLYLRTGANGSCKTLFTLKDVRQLQIESGRPVAWNGRFKLKPEKEAEFGWKKIEFKDWQAEPDGTIFLIDECHNDMPVRPNSAPVPDHIRMLAEHRARGFDFFLLTQHPGNIDNFVRKIIGAPGWHQHLKRVFGASNGTRVLQWDSVHMNCEKDGSGKTAQISTRVQPKEVYGWYDSAMLHTGKRRIPKQVWYFIGGLVVAVGGGWYAVHKLMNMTGAKPPEVQQTAAGPVVGGPVGGPGSGGSSDRKPMTPAEYVAAYQPRIPGLMHSAPIYDKLTEPKRVPVPAACVEIKADRLGRPYGCKCFTQDATPYPVDLSMCRQLVANGSFLAFQAEGDRKPLEQPQTPRQSPEMGVAAPSGLTVIDGAGKAAGGATSVAAAGPAPDLGSKPRVRPGSPWSFELPAQ
ncbi:zonular occludens toxin domain-containing protein [Variovorax sp. tm]|uniref:zonular occludens toxin domain-containing protein n=1 Tax=Variovorax atrisoli TaxID=3394203 RepID=UPI003A7F8A2F